MKTEVKAVRHKDIKGKELLYLVIGTSEKMDENIIINVGVGTFEAVEKMEAKGGAKEDNKNKKP